MKRQLTLLALCSAFAWPAVAQMTPAQTNQDPAAARMEARNARGAQLTDVTPEQARANELQRCANLPPFYRTDCEARVQHGVLPLGRQAAGARRLRVRHHHDHLRAEMLFVVAEGLGARAGEVDVGVHRHDGSPRRLAPPRSPVAGTRRRPG